LKYSKRYLTKIVFYGFQRAVSSLIWPLYGFQERFFPKNQARILMYHCVSDFPCEKAIPYDNVPPELFKTHMKILASEHYNVISLRVLAKAIESKQDIPPRTITITFDDGYKNNYLNAFPILENMGFCATFFLIVNAINKRQPFEHLLWDTASRRHFLRHPESRLPFNWREVQEMARNGMEFGSHGLTHRSIGYLEPEAARREIFESKAVLENAISKKVKCFSYPFGSHIYSDFNAQTEGILRDAGYEGACTTEIGAVSKGNSVYELRRIPIRETDNSTAFKQKIVGAYDWVGSCKRMFQRNMKRVDRIMW
jgi:peptidoglycan/xylan/chitin deacetylase (PgdA/CDA1 family)